MARKNVRPANKQRDLSTTIKHFQAAARAKYKGPMSAEELDTTISKLVVTIKTGKPSQKISAAQKLGRFVGLPSE